MFYWNTCSNGWHRWLVNYVLVFFRAERQTPSGGRQTLLLLMSGNCLSVVTMAIINNAKLPKFKPGQQEHPQYITMQDSVTMVSIRLLWFSPGSITIPGSLIFFSHIFPISQCIWGYVLAIDHTHQGLFPTVFDKGKHIVFLNQSREELHLVILMQTRK